MRVFPQIRLDNATAFEERRHLLSGLPKEIPVAGGDRSANVIRRDDLVHAHDFSARSKTSLASHLVKVTNSLPRDSTEGRAVEKFLSRVYDDRYVAGAPARLWEDSLQQASLWSRPQVDAINQSADPAIARAALQGIPDAQVRDKLITVHDMYSELLGERRSWMDAVVFADIDPDDDDDVELGQVSVEQAQSLPNNSDAESFAYPRFLEDIYHQTRTDGMLASVEAAEAFGPSLWAEALAAGVQDEARMELYRTLTDTSTFRIHGSEVSVQEVADARADVAARIQALVQHGYVTDQQASDLRLALHSERDHSNTSVWRSLDQASQGCGLWEGHATYLREPFNNIRGVPAAISAMPHLPPSAVDASLFTHPAPQQQAPAISY
ncbi:hypothetical protein [Leucobacter aridicollis]|uniref:hypothetical protein n=1 Tax=Leucobacter aridicollis TaxID=283878 RepID=UPI002103F4DB|nr:hypothetical protein [Leucobacter aridicollis]UTX53295.1 hypothetical protein KI794_00555 [Leucobacter aridicollis]